MTARHRSSARLAGAALAVVAALLSLVACGGSSTPTGSAAGPAGGQGSSSDGAAPARSGATRDVVSRGTTVQRPLRGTGGAEVNDENARSTAGEGSTGTGAVANPCKLVSQAQAQAIVRAPISPPQTAPLGPTCIYERRGGGEQITLAVEALSFAKLERRIHGLTRTALPARHTAYCGRYGRATTFVPLAHGQVLSISAPCAIGIRFAAIAARQLGS